MKTVVAFLLLCGLQLAAQDMQSCPMHKEHMKGASQHQADVEKHGDEAMGFPHDKTTHHFRLYSDGGAIEVTVNDSNDSQNVQAIRSHLTHIVTMFSNGDFSIPMFVHDQVPPGVPVMKEKRPEISYSFEALPAGGRVRIKTTNPDALKAIYDFLRFQIEDHHTGDTTDLSADMPPGMDHATHLKMMAEAGAGAGAGAQHHHPGQEGSVDPRPEFRDIKSLTAEEIQAYQEGIGHGMAKAAERNHYPGPRHVLDLAKELQLSAGQTRQIQAIEDAMSQAAVATGKQVIDNERKLNALFADKKIDQAQLESLTAESALLQGKLRLMHLSAHLQTQKLLSESQIAKYDDLRGYKDGLTAAGDTQRDHNR